MYNSSLTYSTARENLYKMALLRFKKEAKEAKKLRKKEINDEAQKIIFLENLKKVRGKISIKRRLDNFSASLEKKIPRINLAAQIPKSERFSFDGGEAGAGAQDMEDMSDYVKEGEEGQAQVDLKKVKKELIEKVKKAREAKRTAQRAKKEAEVAKVAKITKNIKNIGHLIKGAVALTSLGDFGISLIINYLIWVVQILAAHVAKIKYIPKLALWEWVCFGFMTLSIIFVLALPFMMFLTPLFMVVGIFK